MKLFWSILAVLALTAVFLGVAVVARRTTPPADCRGRVVMVKGPHGQPLECVCIEGTMSTCFSPGP
jgi:hypothetical protein